MSIDKHSIVNHPLARFGTWGSPYHGLVTADRLTLPNGQEIDWPQPYAAGMPDLYGSTRIVRVPGTPAVVRTEEQQAADAAAGHEWRDAAMISGVGQVYGKELNGWIYTDPDGVRWLVQVPGLAEVEYLFSGIPTITVTLKRFGAFGKDPEQHDYPRSVGTWGQIGSNILFDDVIIDRAHAIVDATSEDGGQAVVMLHKRRLSYAAARRDGALSDPVVRYPLGFLLLSISGPGASASVSFSVLRTRQQTISVSRSEAPFSEQWYFRYYNQENAVDGSGNGTITWTAAMQEVGYPGDTPSGPYHKALIRTGTSTATVDRLLAVWPDGAGGFRDVKLRIDYTATHNNPAPAVTVSDFVSIETYEAWVMVSKIEPQIHVEQYREASISESMTIKLMVGATVIDTISASNETTSQQTLYWSDLFKVHPNQTAPVFERELGAVVWDFDTTATYDGTVHSSTVTDGVNFLPWNQGLFIVASFQLVPAVLWGNSPVPHADNDLLTQMFEGAINWFVLSPKPGDAWNGWTIENHGAIARQSPQILGMRTKLWRSDVGLSMRPFTYRVAATPSGAYGTPTTRPFSTTERVYGSWNAYDGSASWLNTSPVCWV